MTILPTTTRSIEPPDQISRGQFAYVCARNQSQAHTLLVQAVKTSGLSQKQLALRTGIDEATVSRVLRRPRNIELNTFSKLLFGACGAMISFSPFYAEKTEKLQSSADKYFFLEKAVSGNSSEARKAVASNWEDTYPHLIVLKTNEYRVVRKIDA